MTAGLAVRDVRRDSGPSTIPLPGILQIEARRIDLPGADLFNLWEQLGAALAVRVAGADVLHCPANTGPRYQLLPLVLTVHDLIPLELESDNPATHRWFCRVKAAAGRATYLVTIVNTVNVKSSKRALGVPEARVIVNHLAVDGDSCESRLQHAWILPHVTGWCGVAVRFCLSGLWIQEKNTPAHL